ncbi:hypothetical protein GGR57DRAFT_517687 [Xylariaceae sp. FL1272]|nr:hypothetical protein GGR57DRAFT_517687 [Xylariaceae sp. FL1272]
MAAPQPLWRHHYWDDDQNSRLIYKELVDTPWKKREDVVWLAWREICACYFRPGVRRDHQNERIQWHIAIPAYRGPDNTPQSSQPDMVVVKKYKDHHITHLNPFPHHVSVSRDHLWIECKSKEKDTPANWRKAIDQLLDALYIGGKDGLGEMFCIVAIGTKWIRFRWSQAQQTNYHVRVLDYDRTGAYEIKYQHCFFEPQDRYMRQYWVNGAPMIDTKMAYDLDDGSSKTRLEEFMRVAHDHQFANSNPYHYLA